MISDSLFKVILDKANINIRLLKHPGHALELATEIFDEVSLEVADGDSSQTISIDERSRLLNEVSSRLAIQLHTHFHFR
jgi:hypothetical protein